MQNYKKCVSKAQKRFDSGNLRLCPHGYCTAKEKFAVYPSAYANGYATQVCKGMQSDFLGKKYSDKSYLNRIQKDKVNPLQRWYNEQWVNVCEKGDGPGGYKVCGSSNGIDDPTNYPYCRAYHKLPGTTVTTAQELTSHEINIMCKAKRSKKQGINGKPTKVFLSGSISKRGGSNDTIQIPKNVQNEAKLGLKLIKNGFVGGTLTGWERAKQLSTNKTIDVKSLADMRAWFARHGPDASNGGTSYPGYCKWIKDGRPTKKSNVHYRGAVAWLIWGGNAAYVWLKSSKIRNVIEKKYPKRKNANTENNL